MADVVAREIEFRERNQADAARARDLAEAAVDERSLLRRTVAPQDLLAAAQVYATLATRRYR